MKSKPNLWFLPWVLIVAAGFVWALLERAEMKADLVVFEGKYLAVVRQLDRVEKAKDKAELSVLRYKSTFRNWEGLVSYYAHAHHGRKTASGETFDMNAFTGASMELAFDTWILVLDLSARHTWTMLRINDRGPDPELGRDLDSSLAGAVELDMLRRGVIRASLLTFSPRPSGGD